MARQHTNQPCTVHPRSVEFRVLDSKRFSAGYGGCDYAGSEESFEAKACDESCTGVGRCRVDFFASGGRIGIGRADFGRSADAEHRTEP
jgi:hypothetical protein